MDPEDSVPDPPLDFLKYKRWVHPCSLLETPTAEATGYRLKRKFRETVAFGQHDLLKDPPFSRLDLISCRNMLTYLNAEAQRRDFDIFNFSLREKGILFLGASESARAASTPFMRLQTKYKLYARGPAVSTLPL
jgi:two-component system CheB/CheR fusion protein